MPQNANESLHTIWSLVPKEQYNSASEIFLAVKLGTIIFNNGFAFWSESLLPLLGIRSCTASQKA